jgi:NitT/TauT family transport system substrate-binding protein
MPVVAIGGLVQRLPDSVISLKGSGIKTPKDLEGRSMTIPPASAIYKLFPAFAAATGIDLAKIKQIQTDSNATLTGLLQGQVDFTVGWAFTDALRVAAQKPIEPPMLLSDYGVNVLGTGFVVQKTTATTKAALIRKFLAATAKSYDEATANTQAAVDAMAQARPNVDPDLILNQLKLFPRFLNSERSKGHGFGWMSPDDWVQTVEILKKYFDLKETVDVASLYTNDLLPAK